MENKYDREKSKRGPIGFFNRCITVRVSCSFQILQFKASFDAIGKFDQKFGFMATETWFSDSYKTSNWSE